MRRLVVFGDSYVEGQRKEPKLMITPYNMCYYLEQELGVEVVNMGKFGSGNIAIMNEVMRYMQREDTSNDAFLIVWSAHMRFFEMHPVVFKTKKLFEINDRHYLVGAGRARDQDRIKYLPEARNPVTMRYFAETAIHACRALCKDYNIPLLMSNSIDNTYMIDRYFWQNKERPLEHLHGNSLDDFIEGGKSNNTLLDIISGNWLKEEEHELGYHLKHKVITQQLREDRTKLPLMTRCIHPWDEGHKVIAETLAPYIKPILEK